MSSLNNFEVNPDDIFNGEPVRWFGIGSNEGYLSELDAVTTEKWPEIINQKGGRASRFIAGATIDLAIGAGRRDHIDRVDWDSGNMAFTLSKRSTVGDWLQDEDVAERAFIGADDKGGLHWQAVGLTSKLAVAAYAEQVWMPPLMYENGSFDNVKVLVRPLSPESIEHVNSLISDPAILS